MGTVSPAWRAGSDDVSSADAGRPGLAAGTRPRPGGPAAAPGRAARPGPPPARAGSPPALPGHGGGTAAGRAAPTALGRGAGRTDAGTGPRVCAAGGGRRRARRECADADQARGPVQAGRAAESRAASPAAVQRVRVVAAHHVAGRLDCRQSNPTSGGRHDGRLPGRNTDDESGTGPGSRAAAVDIVEHPTDDISHPTALHRSQRSCAGAAVPCRPSRSRAVAAVPCRPSRSRAVAAVPWRRRRSRTLAAAGRTSVGAAGGHSGAHGARAVRCTRAASCSSSVSARSRLSVPRHRACAARCPADQRARAAARSGRAWPERDGTGRCHDRAATAGGS